MKTLKFTLVLALLFLVVSSCFEEEQNGEENPSAQTWTLTFTAGTIVQVVKVTVTPFTNSGTFFETSDSQGLWIYDVDGTPCYRLNVGGNIVHDSPGDRWSFVAMSGGGCGMQTLGSNSSGTANGNFPDADYISNGVVTLTTQSPLGTVSGVVNWIGVRN